MTDADNIRRAELIRAEIAGKLRPGEAVELACLQNISLTECETAAQQIEVKVTENPERRVETPTGLIVILPTTRDEHGEYLWEFIPIEPQADTPAIV